MELTKRHIDHGPNRGILSNCLNDHIEHIHQPHERNPFRPIARLRPHHNDQTRPLRNAPAGSDRFDAHFGTVQIRIVIFPLPRIAGPRQTLLVRLGEQIFKPAVDESRQVLVVPPVVLQSAVDHEDGDAFSTAAVAHVACKGRVGVVGLGGEYCELGSGVEL